MVELVRAALASAQDERVIVGSRKMEVATVRITDAGRRALTLGAAICGVDPVRGPHHEQRVSACLQVFVRDGRPQAAIPFLP